MIAQCKANWFPSRRLKATSRTLLSTACAAAAWPAPAQATEALAAWTCRCSVHSPQLVQQQSRILAHIRQQRLVRAAVAVVSATAAIICRRTRRHTEQRNSTRKQARLEIETRPTQKSEHGAYPNTHSSAHHFATDGEHTLVKRTHHRRRPRRRHHHCRRDRGHLTRERTTG